MKIEILRKDAKVIVSVFKEKLQDLERAIACCIGDQARWDRYAERPDADPREFAKRQATLLHAEKLKLKAAKLKELIEVFS